MKSNKLSVLILLIAAIFAGGCEEFLDINQDPNNPTEIREDLLLTGVLANFSYEVVGGYPARVSNTWVKQTAYAMAPTHYGNYDIDENDVNNFWRFFSYSDVMSNARQIIDLAEENGNPHYSAISKVVLAWNLSLITDFYGEAPYSQAFQGQAGIFKPEYDSQEEIYETIQQLLDEAIAEAGQESFLSPSDDDFIYGGDMAAWQNLARTLKARFYLRLSNAPGKTPATQAELALDALEAGAISGNAQAPSFPYFSTPGSENPWYQYAIDGKWNDGTRPTVFYVELLDSLNDPRRAHQFAMNDSTEYFGSLNDGTQGDTQIGDAHGAADAPLYWLVYAEVPFMRAEAEFLSAGRTVTPAVAEAYAEGIEASLAMYGIEGDELAAYLAHEDVVLSADAEEAYAQIMTQKYIANYLQAEVYNDWRRTGYPELSLNEEAVVDYIPLRFPYPSSERLYNSENVQKTGIPITRDALKMPVWWDQN